jgi:hypothetical protein
MHVGGKLFRRGSRTDIDMVEGETGAAGWTAPGVLQPRTPESDCDWNQPRWREFRVGRRMGMLARPGGPADCEKKNPAPFIPVKVE